MVPPKFATFFLPLSPWERAGVREGEGGALGALTGAPAIAYWLFSDRDSPGVFACAGPRGLHRPPLAERQPLRLLVRVVVQRVNLAGLYQSAIALAARRPRVAEREPLATWCR